MLTIALTIVGALSMSSNIGVDDAVVDYLRPILSNIGGAARVNYAGTCTGRYVSVPSIDAQPAPPGTRGISAVRQIFRSDPHVAVMRDRSGMFRITIGSPSTTVLQTRLPALTLDSNTQYTPLAAVNSIAIAADIYAKQKRLGFGLASTVFEVIMRGPSKGAPHLPGVMQNVTIDEALDSVARTFKGIVLYGGCKQPDGKELFKISYIRDS